MDREILRSEMAILIDQILDPLNNKKVDIDVLLDIADVLGVTAEYFRDSPKSEPHTRAAHFDGTEYTEEQLDRIEAFAKFIKQEDK